MKAEFDFENIKYTKQIEIGDGEKQTIYKTLADIQKEYPQIDIERIMEEKSNPSQEYDVFDIVFIAMAILLVFNILFLMEAFLFSMALKERSSWCGMYLVFIPLEISSKI